MMELRQKVGPVEPVGAEAALYTDEDKVFCVKRMWAEGLTPTAASRLWGAPSRRTLAAWEKEALGGGLAVEAPRVPGACRRAKHARYPEETRAEALRLLGLGKPTPVVHTDGGACYRTERWKSALAAAGASRSMSRKGTCPDNARAEGFFGTLKQEFLYGREWAGVGREEFEGLLSGYMGWYVGRRPRRFREGGRARYETLAEHRRRLGYPVPPFAAQQAQ